MTALPPLHDEHPPDVDQVARLLLAAAEQDSLHAYVLIDPQRRIRWVNDTATRVFDRTREALIGQPLALLFRPDDVERGTVTLEVESAETCGHAENDRWMQRGNGSAFWAAGATNSIRDASGRLVGFMKVLRNRTDMREYTLALRNERDALAAERDASTARLAKNAHELRNPLAAIAGAAEVLRRLAGDADGRAHEAIERLHRQVGQLVRLIDDFTDATNASAPAQRARRTRVVVQDAITAALDAVAPGPSERTRVSCLLQPTPVAVDIDPLHLQQILVNLIGNAFKYTPGDRPIWIRLSIEGAEAVLRIEDRGVGIAPETLSRIFELFTRAPDTGSTPGSGIGLAVVRELVGLYGGTVLAQSEGVGRGAIFTLRLPRCDDGGIRDEAAVVAASAAGTGRG